MWLPRKVSVRGRMTRRLRPMPSPDPKWRFPWMSASAREKPEFGPAISPRAISGSMAPTAVERLKPPLVLVAACALIDSYGRVLIAKRPEGKSMAGLWEFPGGKIESGERPEQSLIRELKEELGIVVKEECLAPLTFASHLYPDFHLLMPLYVCRRWEGFVEAREQQTLKWVRPNELRNYPMPPADEPLISHLTTLL